MDSMQICRGMTVGTAALRREEMEGVPTMVAVADPAESWSVARYVREADACAGHPAARGKAAGAGGGTGLYLDALVQGAGLCHAATRAREYAGNCRKKAGRRMARGTLLEALRAVDPEGARAAAPAGQRIVRRWRSITNRGETIRAHDRKNQEAPRYDAAYIGLAFRDQEDMKERIDRRSGCDGAGGLLDEVRALLAMRIAPEYRHAGHRLGVSGVLDGALTEAGGH